MEAATGVGFCGACQGCDVAADGVDVCENCGSGSLLDVLSGESGREGGSEEEGNDAGSELHFRRLWGRKMRVRRVWKVLLDIRM